MVDLRKLIKKFSLDKKRPISKILSKQIFAQNTINNKIRLGKIKRPNICHNCFIKCKPDAHHPNYSKPNLVQWLCRSCHKDFHLEKKFPCISQKNSV